jgi:hypothetical protein
MGMLKKGPVPLKQPHGKNDVGRWWRPTLPWTQGQLLICCAVSSTNAVPSTNPLKLRCARGGAASRKTPGAAPFTADNAAEVDD